MAVIRSRVGAYYRGEKREAEYKGMRKAHTGSITIALKKFTALTFLETGLQTI